MPRLLASLVVPVVLGLLLGLGTRDAAAQWPWSIHFLFPPQAGLYSACLTCGWHGGGCLSPYSFGENLDFAASCSDSGQNLYFRGYGFHTPWSQATYVGYAQYYAPDPWECHEVRARIWDKDGNWLGDIRYVHAVGTYPITFNLYASGESGYLNWPPDDFAQMVNPETQGCPWYGVHVHEGHANSTGSTPFFLSDTSSTCSQYPSCVAYPCSATLHDDGDFCSGYDPRDWYNNWVRGFCSGDPDCDFFKDAKEQYITGDQL